MSRLSEIVSYRRKQGGSISGSLAGGIKDRLKEKFDPRQMLNQKGLLVSLFPGLKPFKAKAERGTRTSGKTIEQSSIDVSNVKPVFESIQYSTKIIAKNFSIFPAMHRDFNVIRQNIVKLLKLEKIDAVTKADMFFKASAKREEMYESQLSKAKEDSKTPTEIKNSKSGSFLKFLAFGGGLALLALTIKSVIDSIDKIRNVDIRDAMGDFGKYLRDSFENMFPSAMAEEIEEIPEAPTGELNYKDILAKIRRGESGGKTKSEDYNIAFRAKGQKTPEEFSGKNLTDMTLQEVLEFQRQRESVKKGQAAIGAYQFMPTILFGVEGFKGKGKIGGLVAKSGLSMDSKFNKENQDKLAETLMGENVKILENLRIPITPKNLAMSWTIGPAGVAAVDKAIREGRGEQSVADALEYAGLPSNRANNPQLVRNKAKDFGDYLYGGVGYSSDVSETSKPEVKVQQNNQKPTSIQKPKTNNISTNISPISSRTSQFKMADSTTRNTGNSLQSKYLDVSMSSISEETPIVFINKNNNQQNVIVNRNESSRKDYLPVLFDSVIV